MIFQAYDFLELYRRYGCSLQMGGSDQWGNIVNGIELTRRIESSEIFGLTTPLLTTASGAKMGKTASGAIWLNEDMLSSWNYWQFWRNTDDADVIKFLKLFTELPINEIDRLGRLQGAEINEAKKILATEATKMLHGIDAANLALETAKKTFEQGGISQDLPTFNIDVSNGISILDILIQTNLAPSKSEARRLIKGGAIKVNDINIANENHILNYKDRANDTIKLSSGKKNHVLIK
jgi:tyrosyl-tRNA synthetase